MDDEKEPIKWRVLSVSFFQYFPRQIQSPVVLLPSVDGLLTLLSASTPTGASVQYCNKNQNYT